MKFPVTQKMLVDWAGPHTFRDGMALFDRKAVLSAEYEPPIIRGTLSWGNRSISCSAEILSDGSCENRCPCRDSVERGIVCPHVIALGLTMIRRYTDPEIERKHEEELRRAERLAAVREEDYIQRARAGTPGAIPAVLRLCLHETWKEEATQGPIALSAALEWDGRRVLLDEVPRGVRFALDERDDNLLFVLEDIVGGPTPSEFALALRDFINVLDVHTGKPLEQAGGPPLAVNAATMSSILRVDMDRENGELLLAVHTELPFMKAGEFPVYVVEGHEGWVWGADNLWPLETVLPGPLQEIYRGPIAVQRSAIPGFFERELAMLRQMIRVETDLSADLFAIEPESPRFLLEVRGSPASLSATLKAVYGETEVIAGQSRAEGLFAHPDPDDLYRFTVRNDPAEQSALDLLAGIGLKGVEGDGLEPVIGCREVLNFLGRDVPALRRRGWKVVLSGRVEGFMEDSEFATPVVRVGEGGDGGWFEVDFSYEDADGQSLSAAEIQRAIRKGDAYIEHDGRNILIDAGAVQTLNDVFADCAAADGTRPGSFRLPSVYASYVKSSLDALDGVDVEAQPQWLRSAGRQNRELALEPVELPVSLAAILRPYQKDGVNWLRFLETNALGGILADEMGLGKTLQTLAWLQAMRAHPEARSAPALIVCPTSLVENWAEESGRFVPQMKVIMLTGGDRHERWGETEEADVLITSYALLRRDIDRLSALTFSVVVLDEAQHIKNRSTQNAIAAKRLKAHHRLVLTGTPIENSVADLWSIMDFLMPGYMGEHEAFRFNYEQPIAQGGPTAEIPQAKLRRKLQPFLLRRLKRDVAKDLPPKIERVATCTLTADQRNVYRELLEQSRRRILDMVDQQGFNRSRMEILKTLLRLRQVCCHLELLKLPGLESRYPSAKLDLLQELLSEAMDAGHRVLIFSQFVSMLTILRRELEAAGHAYCYLDGSTKERLKVVHEFNRNRSIPVFLISLKAGGTGLNLTGADMVIHYDPWWNPAVENQATDRAYRIGQHRTVYAIKLIARDTVEERVLAMQRRKQSIIDATLETDEQVMGKLTWEDVRELLAL